ncbi:class I SAM-dependent DNA methyltransferase [Aerolutibacter ruishenii]|uniref:site-specific DNA-methyltransferase (adenine-specific) n=1 Tax=Aerolutibacter ruishenii TaxID=686800 RepID=A0A562LI45_9GAMM|nr:DNA methyltransferase [Lysobacter ruishenii]TWI07288.1 type II restriction/modification system DNA methylase subunit YeeA [Lysobacter ruishenii]
MADTGLDAADAFISKWQGVTASELSTSQSFLSDLCRLLGVDTPHPTPEQDYMFERPITFRHGDGSSSAGRIDLYRRGVFVLESKKLKAATHTKGFDDALLRARSQAEAYARALPASEGRPPFVVVVDVGNRIELYAEFSRSGATYTPFPDPSSHRIALTDLRRDDVRERLRKLWTDPLSLDPSRESARVTRAIAAQLAELAKSLEKSGHPAEAVAQFLMRCLFTMFAEDVKLLPHDSFRDLLQRHAEQPDIAMRMLAQLWRDMDAGGFSAVLANDVLRFNGKLFKQPDTLPLDAPQLALLIDAARADWKHVEPAIFGTLLERALSPGERHKLGAYYTPRAYVERLVLPTVIEPLRAEWSNTQAAALTLAAEDKPDEAVAELLKFHHRLCTVRVLDPACGSGNFLYVTLEHLKRLEGEVLNALDELGHRQTGLALGGERADAMAGETVDPHNLLGIELNPRAAAIAEVVLWIGYLQWHFRTRGDVKPPQPVIRDFRNIENRDAVLAYDRVEYVTDEKGVPVTRWDGKTMKPSPVTGEDIPDETARVPVERYVNPRKAAWPEADFVVGNPPFIGGWRMRAALGEGYVDAIWSTYPKIPPKADLVMFWWDKAAELVRSGVLERFGFITTNSIGQVFQRRVIENHVAASELPLGIVFAVPDHPWVDSGDGAAVRIAMTVGQAGAKPGRLAQVIAEEASEEEMVVSVAGRAGVINADLTIGADVSSAKALRSNEGLSSPGVQLYGSGFIIDAETAKQMIVAVTSGRGARVIRPYVNGRDLMQVQRGVFVIDFFGMDRDEAALVHPMAYQRALDYVKPERDQNRRAAIRDKWWRFGWERPVMRAATDGLSRYVATVETSKHRVFVFLSEETLPDNMLTVIATDDASILGVLSSITHVTWALAAGGRLGVGNDPRYNKTRCFEPFPFPAAGENHEDLIRIHAEHLDTHRKRQQAAHPDLTLTGMYNVLDKLRSGEPLTAKERTVHEHGLVSVLRQLHDDLDAAVLDAYGWSDLTALLRVAHGNDAPAEGQTRDDAKRAFDEAILERLVALNAERAAEEARGLVRWLRPEFQNPQARAADAPAPEQGTLDAGTDDASDDTAAAAPIASKPQPWPKDTVEQVRAVADLLAASPAPLSLDEIAGRFTGRGPWKKRLPQLLEMLVALGRAQVQHGMYLTAG